jgi:uncharacterized LabA/DUF88 family protein
MASSAKERVNVYIDGFNLYFGMTQKWRDMKWLNVQALAQSLLKPPQVLGTVYYFTARISNNPEKQKRQSTYLEALDAMGVQLVYGHYNDKIKECLRCGNKWNDYEEKMTDVNIATNLILDALNDKYDTALLISGDSDLVPPINAIHAQFKGKRVMVGFPPNRHTNSVEIAARGSFVIGRKKLKDAQLPDQVKAKTGFILDKPEEWK